MSRTRDLLKKIASGEEYKALAAAIEKKDNAVIVSSYIQVTSLVEEAQKEITEGINSLQRQNKEEDRQKFQAAFDMRVKTALPKWQWLNEELRTQKVTEGVVIGLGKQGDPLVRTQAGRLVIVKGATQKEGEKVKIQVTSEGPKVDFGRVFELTPESFYYIMSHETRDNVTAAFTTAREHVDSYLKEADKKSYVELGELLKELEDVRILTAGLQADESQDINARIQAFRRRLLGSSVLRMAFEFLTQSEEKGIRETCQNDAEKVSKALSAPGLLRRQAHETLKTEFAGEEPKGLSEITNKLESNVNNMQAALELMEFQSEIEDVLPNAKQYLAKMDIFFERLNERARRAAFTLAEEKIYSAAEVESAIKNVFSDEAIGIELRRVFQTLNDYSALREALVELRTRVGNKESAQAEAAIKPYLRQKLSVIFGDRKVASSQRSA